MRQYYLIGLGVGLIPLIVFLVAYGLLLNPGGSGSNAAIVLLLAALVLYVIELIVTIIFLIRQNLRFVGYGLLTAFLATPIIAAIGCNVIPNLVHR